MAANVLLHFKHSHKKKYIKKNRREKHLNTDIFLWDFPNISCVKAPADARQQLLDLLLARRGALGSEAQVDLGAVKAAAVGCVDALFLSALFGCWFVWWFVWCLNGMNWKRNRECPQLFVTARDDSRALKPNVSGTCDHLAVH